MKYQWGYIGDAQCYDCDTHSELWVNSAMKTPRCLYCLHQSIYDYLFGMRNDENVDKGIEELLNFNPLRHPEIYGEPAPWCLGCGHLILEGSSTIEAKDYNGNEHTVHDTCVHSCEECDEVYIRERMRYTTRRVRMNGSLPSENIMWMDIVTTVYGTNVCEDCVSNLDYVSCDDCSNYGSPDDISVFEGNDYCEDCYNSNVSYCDDCEESYFSNHRHVCEYATIKEWDYKPSPVFFGHRGATYHLGLELEVENTRGEYDTEDTAEEVQQKLGDHAYLKHDGSISEGFEIVTHPHTLEHMKSDFDWSVLSMLREYGFRSWNASNSSCGIHVHVSRTAFGSENTRVADHRRDAHMLRFMKLIYDNQRQVERLAGRSSSRWANFGDKGQLVNKVKHGQQENGRYSAVNTDNYNTLEVRVFRGSLKKERVLSALEFVTASVEYTRDLKVTSSNKALDWSHFVAYVVSNEATYPNLLSKISESLASEIINN